MSKAALPSLSYIVSHLDDCMVVDRHALSVSAKKIAKLQSLKKPIDKLLSRLQQRYLKSCQLVEKRSAAVPSVSYPDNLPVSENSDEIKQLILDHQVVILCGETGSGKTTQLPKICLELGYGVKGIIAHTQPRRIAARSVCNRISEELACESGLQIGYKVRFDDKTSDKTLVKLMTDGMLLTETQHDRYLSHYEVIIIDEAHERSLNIDFLIGYLKFILPRRPDIKIIITSATIDHLRFSRHFGNAPVIEVSGRTYPVDIQYRPLVSEDDDRDIVSAVVDAVLEIDKIDRGDILVFLSGEREIREVADELNKQNLRLTEILPLFGRLSSSEQNRIFKPGSKRRIVLATNIAETSLTVPGIRYVIDSGQARVSRYSHRLKIQQLPIERISQASANQRAGRCGRVSEGVCYRLYSEEDFQTRAIFTQPEITRTNLAAVILQMQALNLGDISDFPFIDAPDSRYIRDGIRQLHELGAIDGNENLTPLGKKLSRLPIDPRIGRMLIAAGSHRCVSEMLVIASALETQDPRERPMDKQQQADQAHARYKDAESDFSSILMLWQFVQDQRQQLTGNQFRKLCKKQFLSWLRLREWQDTYHQLKGVLQEIGLKTSTQPAGYDDIHQALLSGLLSQIGHKDEDKFYVGARNSRFMIFPGSGVRKKAPDWLVSAEIVETSQVFARTVARVESEWIEKAGSHLLHHQYTEPRWYSRKGYVSARETVSLYGLTLAADRRVNYGSIDPDKARTIFIDQALVGRDYETGASFWKQNKELLEEVESLEHRQRRRDVLVDDDVIYAFYDARIPAGIHNQRSFDKWRKQAEYEDPSILVMTRDLLMQHDAIGVSQERFPDYLDVKDNALALHYHFSPGHEVDGITVDLPAVLLDAVEESDFEWLVPGLLDEKIIALLKTLPKVVRKNFVPAPDYARACIEKLTIGEGSLISQLTHILSGMSGYPLQTKDWRLELLPEHLFFNFNVIDLNGHCIASGRNLRRLQLEQGGRAQEVQEQVISSSYEREGISEWDFGDLEEACWIEQGKHKVKMYPAVWDCTDSISLSLCSNQDQAEEQSRWGVLRLALLSLTVQRRDLIKRFRPLRQHALIYSLLPINNLKSSTLGGDIIDEWINQCVYLSFLLSAPNDHVPRSEAQFQEYCDAVKNRVSSVGEKVYQAMQSVMTSWISVETRLKKLPQDSNTVIDIRMQLEWLLYQGFVAGIISDWIFEYPRYVQSIDIRLDRYLHDPQRDVRLMGILKPFSHSFYRIVREWLEAGYDVSELDEIRWSLENFRISLFSQELGTRIPISEKRLIKLFSDYGLEIRNE